MKFILGSASPRRQAIFEMFFPNFEIISPDIIEESNNGEDAADFTKRMSLEKMNAVLADPRCPREDIFAASADTIIVIDNTIIGKPRNFGHAVEILGTLSGKTHQVITGLTLFYRQGTSSGRLITGREISHVTFKKLSNETIERYLSSIDYLDKSGSYAIQENGSMIIKNISGSKSNIIGFPTGLFFRLLNEIDGIDLLL